jgi:NADPH-dependent ferric siderophore reductase
MSTTRLRREPPPYREVSVAAVRPVTGWLIRVTLEGHGVEAMDEAGVASSVRLLVPGPEGLLLPDWNGNEFLLSDGSRPVLRTLTPLRRDGDRLDVEVVLHADGPLSDWAKSAAPGTAAAVSGPGRPSGPAPGAPAYLIAGDEAAVPAIGRVLAHLTPAERVEVLIETRHPGDPAPLSERPDVSVVWLPAGDAPGEVLAEAAADADLPDGVRVWAAGEAAAMHRIRSHLKESGVPRTHATVRGYWKHGKASGASGE